MVEICLGLFQTCIHPAHVAHLYKKTQKLSNNVVFMNIRNIVSECFRKNERIVER